MNRRFWLAILDVAHWHPLSLWAVRRANAAIDWSADR